MKKLLTIIITTITIGSALAQNNVENNKSKIKETPKIGQKEKIHRSKENIDRLKKDTVEHEKMLKNKNINSDTISILNQANK